VAAGVNHDGGKAHFALARYNTNGSLDNSFGSGGKVSIDFGYEAGASSIVSQPDGKLVVAGVIKDNSGNWDFALARLNTNGSLDASFGYGGKVTTEIGTFRDIAQSVIVQPDGELVAVGYSGDDIAIVRYNSNGSLDSTFDGLIVNHAPSGNVGILGATLQGKY